MKLPARALWVLPTLAWLVGTASAQQCDAPNLFAINRIPGGGTSPRDVVVADFDHGHYPDVAVVEPGSKSVSIFTNVGASFLLGPTLPFPSARDVEAADLNLDGWTDVIVSGESDDAVYVALSDGAGGFLDPVETGVGKTPTALTLGYFDADGFVDVAVAEQGDGAVSVLISAGAGFFTVWSSIPMIADELAVADVDGDGKADLVSTDAANARIHVALGNGDGTFRAPAASPTGDGPRGLVVGDYNRDGFPDVVTANAGSHDVSFLKGDGSASFSLSGLFPAGDAPMRVDVGDFDRNGMVDLAVGDEVTKAIHILLGDGKGNFSTSTDLPAESPTFDVAVGDFNSDGRTDVVASLPAADAIIHFESQYGRPCPKPSFARLGRAYSTGSSPRAIGVAQLDSDFNLDFVTANAAAANISRFVGEGSGDFIFPLSYSTGSTPVSLDVALLDGDAFPDVVTANEAGNSLSILTNSGTASFSNRTDVPLGATPVHVVAADVTQDGKPDLIVVLSAASVLVGANDGAGGFPSFLPYSVGPSPRSVAVGDLDGDGRADLAVAEAGNQIVLLRNSGGGNFVPAGSSATTMAPVAVRAGQLDGDGRTDLVVAGTSRVQTLLGSGPFTFITGADVLLGAAVGSPHALALEDFDGDGVADVAVATTSNYRVTVLRGNGSGQFSKKIEIPVGEAPSAIAAGDVDRDGYPDLLVAQAGPARVLVHYGDGTFSFGPPFFPSDFPNDDARGVATGDVNGDGKLDLVVADYGIDAVTRYLGDGTGAFGPPSSFPVAGGGPRWLTVEDYDNDGKLDLVVSAEAGRQLVFMKGDGSGGFDSGIRTSTGDATRIHRAADLDFDGNLDLAVVSGTNVEIHLGDGTGHFFLLTRLDLGGTGRGLQVADFDRNGFLDIAATEVTKHRLVIFWASQNFYEWPTVHPIPLGSGFPDDFDVADFNRDGLDDFIVPMPLANHLAWIRSIGPASYSPPAMLATPPDPVTVRVADFDRDGNEDFVVAGRSSHLLTFFMGDEFTGLDLRADYSPVMRLPRYLAVADFDSDSLPDLAVAPDTAFSFVISGVEVIANTNCRERVLRIAGDVSSCDLPPSPFASQPYFFLLDDGQNPIECPVAPVAASIRPGTGPTGASLLGQVVVQPALFDGIVTYGDLAVDRPGKRYQLQFTHDTARKVLSRVFSEAPTITATGPTAICEGAPALYDSEPGFDAYDWRLDGAPVGGEPAVDLTGRLAPGNRVVDIFATVDTCVAIDSVLVDVTPNLASIDVEPTSDINLCDSCTGPNVYVTPTGGGAISYQWGYRTSLGGPITDFVGETSDYYTVEGSDFGAGTFYLVVTVTPACGSPIVSSDIRVDVTGGGPEPLVAFTALSTKGQNFLQWSTPVSGPCNAVRILRSTIGFPTDPNDIFSNVQVGAGDFACPATGKDAFPDTALSDGTKYYYSAFVKDASGNFSLRETVAGRPFDHTTGRVKWAFSTGATSMAQASVRLKGGIPSVYIVSNDSRVYAVAGGASGGQWLAAAKPFGLGLPSQVRNPVVSFPVGVAPFNGPNGALFVTSQDGNVYALDADELDQLWASNAGESVLGSASGIFFGFGGPKNLIFVGTKNTVGPNNLFRAYDVEGGGSKWDFDNSAPQGGDGTPLGLILGGSSVEYGPERVFFGSRKGSSNATIWALDVSGPTPMLLWSRDVGDVDTSPVLLQGSPKRLIVASNPAKVDLLDADNSGSSLWSSPYSTLDGNVKGFVFPHSHSGTQYFMFSTVNNVTSIRDNGKATIPTTHWQITSIPFPSTPLFLPGTTSALVGGADGKLYQINGVDTTFPTTTFLLLGDGGSAVGPPSFDVASRLIYVGTDEGVVYAIIYP